MVIYGLYDPREATRIRYVGKTSRTAEKRRDQHVGEAHRYRPTHFRHWLFKLADEGVVPSVVELERCFTLNDLNAAEVRWIAELPDLTNTTPGGTGGNTRPGPWPVGRSEMIRARFAERRAIDGVAYRRGAQSEEYKEQKRQQSIRYWEEVKSGVRPPHPTRNSKKLPHEPRVSKKGVPQSPEHAAKSRVAALGKRRTEEQRENYRKAWTQERRDAHAEKIRQSHVQRRQNGV